MEQIERGLSDASLSHASHSSNRPNWAGTHFACRKNSAGAELREAKRAIIVFPTKLGSSPVHRSHSLPAAEAWALRDSCGRILSCRTSPGPSRAQLNPASQPPDAPPRIPPRNAWTAGYNEVRAPGVFGGKSLCPTPRIPRTSAPSQDGLPSPLGSRPSAIQRSAPRYRPAYC